MTQGKEDIAGWGLDLQGGRPGKANGFMCLAAVTVVFLGHGVKANNCEVWDQVTGLQQEITAEDPTGCLEKAHHSDACAGAKKKTAPGEIGLTKVQLTMHIWKIQFLGCRVLRSTKAHRNKESVDHSLKFSDALSAYLLTREGLLSVVCLRLVVLL